MRISSLCIVKVKSDGFSKQLVRLADLENNVLVPIYRGNPSLDRVILYYDPKILSLEEDDIALVTWEPIEIDKQKIIKYEIKWIEVLVFDCMPQEIIKEICKGVHWCNGNHNMLLVFENNKALFWDKKEMKSCINGTKILSGIDYLYVYQIDESLIKSCNTNFKLSDKKYYASYDLGKPCSKQWTIDFKTIINKIINEITINHIKTFSLSRKERQAIRNALNDINNINVFHEISNELLCSFDEAKQYYTEFEKNITMSLCINGLDGMLFQSLIENNSDLYQKMYHMVETNWNNNNNKKLQEYTQIQEKIEKQKEVFESISKELSIQKKEVEALQKLKIKLNENLKNSIFKAREDISIIVSDYSWLLKSDKLQENEKNDFTPIIYEGIYHDNFETESIEFAINNLSINLCEAGILETDLAKNLACFLISAFYNKANLLLAGIGGKEIATALSASVCNSELTILYLTEKQTIKEIENAISISSSEIIFVSNVFLSNTLDMIVAISEAFPEKMFIYWSVFSDSISVEPHSLYQYMLPVLTDYYVSANATKEKNYIFEDARKIIESLNILINSKDRLKEGNYRINNGL